MMSYRTLIVLGLATLQSCRLTEVALVTVRNETKVDVAVKVRLPGQSDFQEDLRLKPAEERTILKYEEPRSTARRPCGSSTGG